MAKFRDVLVGVENRVTKLSAATTDDDSGGEGSQGTLIGTLVLLTVPLSWGTYVPVGKLILKRKIQIEFLVFAHREDFAHFRSFL